MVHWETAHASRDRWRRVARDFQPAAAQTISRATLACCACCCANASRKRRKCGCPEDSCTPPRLGRRWANRAISRPRQLSSSC